MPARRILLVDDQRDVTRVLRASLETLGRGYVVVDVPSGEEALLEINNNRFDLLITDIRLPGMSGLQLVERMRKVNSEARAILITGSPSPDVQAQAARLDAFAFFTKPLHTDQFLTSVQEALGQTPEAPRAPERQRSDSPGISERLATLRQDLGALSVLMVDLNGRVVVRAGDVTALNLDALMPPLMSCFNSGMKITSVLGGLVPSNIQFFDGDQFDIYTANVGVFFALVMVLEGDRGSAQMGPVLRYGRRAVDDLLNVLSDLGVQPAPEEPMPLPATALPEPPEEEPVHLSTPDIDNAVKQLAGQDIHAFWDSNGDGSATDTRPDGLSYDQAVKLGLFPGDAHA